MSGAQITFVLPFYNEQDFIGATLASLAAQGDRRFAVRLVDNASDDNGAAIAQEAALAMPDIAVEFLQEPRQGKLFALESGCRGILTPLVGTLDADTIYPPDYVAKILEMFAADDGVAIALSLHEDESGLASASKWLQTRLRPNHCHGGGCGQAFRRDALEAAGGFDPKRWPFVLEDHEIIHRVSRFGSIAYRRDHTFQTSDRRDDYSVCSWTLAERIAYKLLPGSVGAWFFSRVLGPRFAKRGLNSVALREGDWR